MTTALFSVDGLDIHGDVSVISGIDNPSLGNGVFANIGSMYLRTNGETWKKLGYLDTAWTKSQDGLPHNISYRPVKVENDYTVEYDVNSVFFNHYYTNGVLCSLMATNYYSSNITIKNLSGNKLTIIPEFGRIEGSNILKLNNKMASVTLAPLLNDWLIISNFKGYKSIS